MSFKLRVIRSSRPA